VNWRREHNKSCLPSREIRASCIRSVLHSALTLVLAAFSRAVGCHFLSHRLSPSARASPQRGTSFAWPRQRPCWLRMETIRSTFPYIVGVVRSAKAVAYPT
jgi:hypothetical protein